MSQSNAHAYTQALIDAWRRFADDSELGGDPAAEEYPGLVESLFVVSCPTVDQFTFRNVGPDVERLFGRDLIEHDFLSLWEAGDRSLVLEAARCAIIENGPIVLQARGAPLEGRSVEVEFTLAPIRNAQGQTTRLLGLCQLTSADSTIARPPVGRVRLLGVFPPAPPVRKPTLRLVVSNT